MNNISICVRNVEEKLKTDFKTWCARHQISMQDAILVLMGIALRKDIKNIAEKNKIRKSLEKKRKALGENK